MEQDVELHRRADPARRWTVRLEAVPGADGQRVLRWKPNAAGRKPVKYRVYGSDEKGFSVSDEPYRGTWASRRTCPPRPRPISWPRRRAPSWSSSAPGVDLPNANKAFYRVVAVDDRGKRSGPSDYAAAARPFIYSKPPETARVGTEFRYQVAAIRSLGDLRLRTRGGQGGGELLGHREAPVRTRQGPAWLRIDESTGVLRGVPDAAGNADVVVKVTLERSVRRLDEGRLSWGHELVKEVVTEKVGSATQRFRITVAP